MSNRQARREQSRTTRTQQQRPSRPSRPSQAPKRGGGSNLPDFVSPGFLLAIGAVIVALAAIAIVVIATGGGGDDDAVSKLDAAAANFPADLADGKTVGSPDAPVVLTEYADFQCPFCLRYTVEDEPMIIDEYVKTGKVRIEFRHRPILGPESVRAAAASECAADQDKFWDYHNHLFRVQAAAGQLTNEKNNSGRFSDSNLTKYAGDLGLDVTAFSACLGSSAASDRVAADDLSGTQLGVSGTPSFFLNGQPLGGTPRDLDAWRSILDQVGEAAVASPTAAASPAASASASPAATTTPSPAASPSASATR